MKISKPVVLAAIILAALCIRIWTLSSVDHLLPLEGLYVDEKTYSMSPFVPGIEGFSRPPGMFVINMLMDIESNVITSRIALSVISLLPALALYLAFRKRGGTLLYIFTAGLALSPFMILYGQQLLPAVPAAALISFSLLSAKNNRTALAGFLTGIAVLLRAELVLVPIILFLFAFRNHFRRWLIFAGAAASAVLPIIILNLAAGAGPVIASNGGENLWFGTEWELVATPPGTEFEVLVSTGDNQSSGDSVFHERALAAIISSPVQWLRMGGSKLLAFFSLPGPGRNFETGWLLQKTWLILLLPFTLLAMSAGTAGLFRKGKSFWQCAAAAVICSGIASAMIYFPSARFRTAVLPAFWFLAAPMTPDWKSIKILLVPAALIILISSLITYPGMERSGLTSMLAAEYMLDTGKLEESAEYLSDAEERGFRGSDYHNLSGVLLSLTGREKEGLEEFERALEIASASPTLWKNYAVSLWSNGRYRPSTEAARRAVYLNPLLREQLRPILEHAENL